jgi:hypothetical protein
VLSTLTQTTSGSEWLSFNVFGDFSRGTLVHWSLDVIDPTDAVLCTGRKTSEAPAETVTGQVLLKSTDEGKEYEVNGTSKVAASTSVSSPPFIYLRFCWSSSGPIEIQGSYLAATLPRITVASQSGTLLRALQILNSGLTPFVQQGGVSASTVTGSHWLWSSDLDTSLGSQASESIPVNAVNVQGLQKDTYVVFVAGVLEGIAGGALIGALTEFRDVRARRNESRSNGSDTAGAQEGA